MANHLKPVTASVIQQLQQASIETLMLTGDDLLTAISVARECHMVSKEAPLYFSNCFPPQWHSYSPSEQPPLSTDQLPPDSILAITGPVFRQQTKGPELDTILA